MQILFIGANTGREEQIEWPSDVPSNTGTSSSGWASHQGTAGCEIPSAEKCLGASVCRALIGENNPIHHLCCRTEGCSQNMLLQRAAQTDSVKCWCQWELPQFPPWGLAGGVHPVPTGCAQHRSHPHVAAVCVTSSSMDCGLSVRTISMVQTETLVDGISVGEIPCPLLQDAVAFPAVLM